MGVVVPRVEDAVYLSAQLRFSELKLFHMFTFHPTLAPRFIVHFEWWIYELCIDIKVFL